MENIKLKIVHNAGNNGSPRLCNSCAHGLVMRGEGMEFVHCSYIREFVSIRVEQCSKYLTSQASDHDAASSRLLDEYTME